MRNSRARLSTGALPRLSRRAARPVLLQGARLLSFVWWTTYGRHRRVARRSRAPRGPHSSVGADASVSLRYRLAFDAELITVVLAEFMRAVFGSLRRRARHEFGIAKPRCGAVTFVQRFGDALNLNIRYHSVVLDGVYEDRGDDQPRFHRLPAPNDRAIALIAARIARRIAHRFQQRGLGPDDEPGGTDPLAEEESWLAALAAASVQGRIAIGPQAGQRLLKLGDRVDPEDLPARSSPLCANIAGLGLHAGVALPARDRQRLERLCRDVARPAIAASRLSALDDGRLLYQLKKRWRDGTTHVVFEPLEFIAKLAALVPPPRVHPVRYHGVLAPGAPGRERIVPPPDDAEEISTPYAQKPTSANPPTCGAASSAQTNLAATNSVNERYYSWAVLMRLVFAIDALECPRCQGPMKILAQIHSPDTTRKILQCLGLPARPPPIAVARPDPQESLPFDSDEAARLD